MQTRETKTTNPIGFKIPQLPEPLQRGLIPLMKSLPEHWQMMDEVMCRAFTDKTDWTDDQRKSIADFMNDLTLAFQGLSDGGVLVGRKLKLTETSYNGLLMSLEWLSQLNSREVLQWMFKIIYSHWITDPERVMDFAELHFMLDRLLMLVHMHFKEENNAA